MMNVWIKSLLVLLLGFAYYADAYAQSGNNSGEVTLAKDDITCFYIIDRVFTDPRNPDKRKVVGGVNFFQVENGQISVAAQTPRTSFFFNGKVDSLETVVVDGVSVIRVHATNSFNSPTIYPYVFEIAQSAEGVISIYARRARNTSFQYFFEVHKASAQEIAETRANASRQ